jgi:predicted ATPase
VFDLVNDGFGTNQLVFLLAKALRKGQTTICIEEPEIHLHPSAIAKLVEVLIDIGKETNRNFIISTHSENFVLALLNKLARQTIAPSDVRIYYLCKEKARTVVEEQRVTDKGQVQGGLRAFYETELEQMREFLSIQEGS